MPFAATGGNSDSEPLRGVRRLDSDHGCPLEKDGRSDTRILIVEDDEGLLRIIGEYLSAYGFEPELAGSAAQARNCLMRSKYDAVLSDLQLPGESGLDLLGHVKSRYPGLPFILVTGSDSLPAET